MADCTKKYIEEINEVSRQLLSRIHSTNTDLSSPPQELDVENSEDQSANKESNEIAEMMKKRQVLITTLFEQNTTKNISSESELIQEMIALDSELTANANLCKQAISEQVIKIKKSKKVTTSYQKY